MAFKRKAESDVAGPRKQKKMAKKSISTQLEQQRSPLLRLCAELRNKIYRYTLVSCSPEVIRQPHALPGLLSTCRQIRREALGIYYTQNSFQVSIHSCDARLFVRFQKHLVALGLQGGQEIMTRLSGGPDRERLVWWCKQVWVGRSVGLQHFGEERIKSKLSRTYRVVSTALEMAMKMKGSNWETVQVSLESLLFTAEMVDEDWKAAKKAA